MGIRHGQDQLKVTKNEPKQNRAERDLGFYEMRSFKKISFTYSLMNEFTIFVQFGLNGLKRALNNFPRLIIANPKISKF